MLKKILFILGIISLGLGCLGIFLPLLPTTPFLLLSAYCFSKSSEKFHAYLLENRIFGQYIRDYQEKKGITLKNKIFAILLLVVSITFSLTRISSSHLKIFLIAVLIGVSYHILKLKTLK
ncbi:YbaN family protein [Fusobacterium sp.]|uniref:YbaN family protein n=1 Tax=Fusobacterium sp. TaxID=68766 RepID=UPI0025BFE17A|nr:YbaN family protein [Fusobacterium sp.]